jgi:hypothetical protein
MINYHLDSGCPSSSTSPSIRNVDVLKRRTSEERLSQEKTSAEIIEVTDDSPVRHADVDTKSKASIAPLFLGTGGGKRKRSTEETPKKEMEMSQGDSSRGKGSATSRGASGKAAPETPVPTGKKPRLDHLKAAQP